MNDYEQCKKNVGFADSKNKCNLPIGHTGMCGCILEPIRRYETDRMLPNDEIEKISKGIFPDE